jgi:hypothetical protein
LPLIQPYLFPGNQQYVNGINFASGGAGALVETNQGLVCFMLLILLLLQLFNELRKFDDMRY